MAKTTRKIFAFDPLKSMRGEKLAEVPTRTVRFLISKLRGFHVSMNDNGELVVHAFSDTDEYSLAVRSDSSNVFRLSMVDNQKPLGRPK